MKLLTKKKIKYVFNGHSFRTEGIEPLDWTYMDGLYLKNIHKILAMVILKILIILNYQIL